VQFTGKLQEFLAGIFTCRNLLLVGTIDIINPKPLLRTGVMNSEQLLLEKRDRKAKPHLEQYAPVWLTEQKIIMQDEAVQFNVVFEHSRYGWVSRRYRYDGFNDVLYYKGQVIISEEAAFKIQEKAPYLMAIVGDIPNAYGG
jgi:hypothetical protein